MIDVLAKLFGSDARVKVLRLFLSNAEECFTEAAIVSRAQVTKHTVKSELKMLQHIGLIKKQTCIEEVVSGKGEKQKVSKKKTTGWGVDKKFEYLSALRSFLLNVAPANVNDVIEAVNGVGRVKLILVAGVFTHSSDSRVDMMVVVDNLKSTKLEAAVRKLEAELGKELRYAVFSSEEFTYRLGIYDRLVRDILDYPHTVVLDKLGSWRDLLISTAR